MVDDVSPDSPASAAGVMLGDQLWRFGSVSGSNLVDGGTVLQAVAVELQVSTYWHWVAREIAILLCMH